VRVCRTFFAALWSIGSTFLKCAKAFSMSCISPFYVPIHYTQTRAL
jgi:hypothetical protein